jgi:hypothetical protein
MRFKLYIHCLCAEFAICLALYVQVKFLLCPSWYK